MELSELLEMFDREETIGADPDVISAGAVVTEDIPPDTLAGGISAGVIKQL